MSNLVRLEPIIRATFKTWSDDEVDQEVARSAEAAGENPKDSRLWILFTLISDEQDRRRELKNTGQGIENIVQTHLDAMCDDTLRNEFTETQTRIAADPENKSLPLKLAAIHREMQKRNTAEAARCQEAAKPTRAGTANRILDATQFARNYQLATTLRGLVQTERLNLEMSLHEVILNLEIP